MKKLYLICALLTTTFAATAQPTLKIENGPYLQAVTDNSFTVVWTTNLDAVAWVEIAPDDQTHFYSVERPQFYQSHIGKRHIGRLHAVRVTGLEAGTKYRYRIMQQSVLSDQGTKRIIYGEGYGMDILKQKPYEVTTLNPEKTSTRFVMVSDIHSQDSMFRLMMKGIKREKVDFVFFNGDMTSNLESEKQMFDGYLKTACDSLTRASIPIFVARGNHENRGIHSPRFLDYYPTPTSETYYTFRQGPAIFVVLDGGEDKPDNDIRNLGLSVQNAYREQEAKWLKGVVASDEYKSAPIKIILIHMPPSTGRGWWGEQEVRRLFTPILNGTGVDLMMCGHTHRYSYVTDGSRGTDFPILINSNVDKIVVDIDASGITARVVNTAGTTIHNHRIDKK